MPFAIILLVVVAVLTNYSVGILVGAGVRCGQTTFEGTADALLGRRGFYAITWFMWFAAIGAMSIYFIMIGDVLPPVVYALHGVLPKRQTVILVCAALTLPICLLRNMSALGRTSLLSTAAAATIAVTVATRGPIAANDRGPAAWYACVRKPDEDLAFVRPARAFAGLGVISGAYFCQHSAFIVHDSLRNATPARWQIVSRGALGVALAVSLVIAIGGYTSFYGAAQGNILNNFSFDDGAVNVSRFLLALTMVLTLPMECFVARQSAHAALSLLWPGRYAGRRGGEEEGGGGDRKPAAELIGRMTTRQVVCLSVCWWGLSLGIGLVFTSVGHLMELTGAVTGGALGYIIHVLCHFYSQPGGPGQLWREAKGAWSPSSPFYGADVRARLRSAWRFGAPAGLATFGAIAIVGGLASIYGPGQPHAEVDAVSGAAVIEVAGVFDAGSGTWDCGGP